MISKRDGFSAAGGM